MLGFGVSLVSGKPGVDIVAGAEVIGGVPVGANGAPGTPYEGLRMVAGDDFNVAPTRWSPQNVGGRYTAAKLAQGRRFQAPDTDIAIWLDAAWRGARSQSPVADLHDGVSFANSRAVFTAAVPSAQLLPLLPTTFGGGRGDAQNRPRLVSGALKTTPSFMFSAKADWAIEAKIRYAPGVARGYWPSFWSTTVANWPDYGEVDLFEGKKEPGGNVNNLMNVIISTSDGGGVQFVTPATRAMPTNRDIHALAVKRGNTMTFYDDVATAGTLALVATYTDARVGRFRGAHDVHLDLAAAQSWDSSTYNAADWPKTYEVDWWRAWVPAAADPIVPFTVLPAINTTPGGSWAATLPTVASLSGGKAGLEEIMPWFDNPDAPGAGNPTNGLPQGMAVNRTTRAVTGTVPATEGGRTFLVVAYSFDDGTPVRAALLPYYVAPAVQGLVTGWSYAIGAAVNETIGYAAFHSGNLGPHTYAVTAPGLTVAGNGTGEVTLSGSASSDVTVTIACTNAIGQTTTVVRTLTAAAASAQFLTDTFSGRANGTDLTAHTGEGGITWSRHPLRNAQSLRMAADGTVYSGDAFGSTLYFANTSPPSPNYEVSAVFTTKTVTTSPRYYGVYGRLDPVALNGYQLFVTLDGSLRRIAINRMVNGVDVLLADDVNLDWVAGQSRTLTLRMRGQLIEGLVDGVVVISAFDSAITAAGRAGLGGYQADAGAPTTGPHISSIAAQEAGAQPALSLPPGLWFEDTFTQAAGPLPGRVAESGGTWAAHPQSSGVSQLSGSGVYQPASATSLDTNSQTIPFPDYYVEADLLVKTAVASNSITVAGRMSNSALSFYGVRYTGAAFILFKSVNGTLTTLATFNAVQPNNTLGVLRLEMQGATLTGKLNGATILGPVVDNAFANAGRVGTRFFSTGAGGVSIGQHFEGMRAGQL